MLYLLLAYGFCAVVLLGAFLALRWAIAYGPLRGGAGLNADELEENHDDD